MSIFRPSLAGFTAAQLDAGVLAFATTTGATDLQRLNKLVRYVKAEGLWSDFVIYPLKSAQNYGTGSTVAPLGGKTSNVMTLYNGPTWGADGITLNGTTQYGSIPDPLSGGNLAMFIRMTMDPVPPAARSAIFSQYLYSDRGWALALQADGSFQGVISSTGSDVAVWDEDGSSLTTADTTATLYLPAAAPAQLKLNGVSSPILYPPTRTLYNNSQPLYLGVEGGTTQFATGQFAALAACNTALSPTQLSTLSTLIEAL